MEKVAPAQVIQNKQPEHPQGENKGKSVSPPGFQLMAGDFSAPIQKKDEKTAESTQCLANATVMDPKWVEFAGKFNQRFQSVLHVFPNIPDPCAPVAEKPADASVTPVAPIEGHEINYSGGETCEVETTPDSGSSVVPPTTIPTPSDSTPAPVVPAPNLYKTPPKDARGSDRANAALSPAQTGSGGKKFAGLYDKSGLDLTAYTSSKLFTVGQRDKLIQFMTTSEIPARLFNGDDVGATTAPQRILMSGLILAQGHFKAGSFEQKVHAKMCWHWAHLTNDYAGTVSGSFNSGAMGSSDFMGNASFNSGKVSSYFDEPTVLAASLPTTEGDGLGPIHEGTGHKKGENKQIDAIAKREGEIAAWDAMTEEELAAAKKKKKKRPEAIKKSFGRKPGMDWSKLALIEPGDWLYIYNANASDSGNHSVIFSHWASDVQTEDGINYRVAVMFSQGQPESGGSEHTSKIGAEFYHREEIKADKDKGIAGVKEFNISQVTWGTRFSDNSKPILSADELIPDSKKDPAQLNDNNKYIETVESSKGLLIDRSKLQVLLQEKGQALLDHIGTQLSKGQADLFKGILAGTNIEKSVKAIQKLTALKTNLDVTRQDPSAKNAEHEAWDKNFKAKQGEITAVGTEQKALEEEKGKLTVEQKTTGIPALKATAKILGSEIKKLKAGDPKIAELQVQLDKANTDIAALEADPEAAKNAEIRAKEIKTRLGEIAKLATAKKNAGTKLNKELAELQKNEPFISAHPASWSGDDVKEKADGKLESVVSKVELEGILSEQPYVKKEVEKKPKPKK